MTGFKMKLAQKTYTVIASLLIIVCSGCTEDPMWHDPNSLDEVVKPPGIKSNKTVLDYYYLLPSSPYFERELGDDTKTERDSGIVHVNLKSGYLIGGHPKGQKFTMALFKNQKDKRDYIMIQRIQYPGDMFPGFINFIEYTHDSTWDPVDSVFSFSSNERERELLRTLQGQEKCIPILPEFGTELEFRKWDPTVEEDPSKGTVLYKYKWNGKRFVFVEV